MSHLRFRSVLGWCLGLLLATSCAQGNPTSVGTTSPTVTEPPQCASEDPPCPPMLAPIYLASEEEHVAGDLLLEPPPSNSPALSATQAVDAAWHHSGSSIPAIDADSVQPIYALFRSANAPTPEDQPVWALRFDGACVPILGGGGAASPSCFMEPWYVVVDANTGTWLLNFND
jgi:hypothetical protein